MTVVVFGRGPHPPHTRPVLLDANYSGPHAFNWLWFHCHDLDRVIDPWTVEPFPAWKGPPWCRAAASAGRPVLLVNLPGLRFAARPAARLWGTPDVWPLNGFWDRLRRA